MTDNPKCKACKQPMYVGLGTQPPVCDNRTCMRYVPSMSERKAGTTFPRPPAAEPEPFEVPELDWTGFPIDWGSTPLFLSDAPDPRDVRTLEVLRAHCEHVYPGAEVDIVDGEVRVTLPGYVTQVEIKGTFEI